MISSPWLLIASMCQQLPQSSALTFFPDSFHKKHLRHGFLLKLCRHLGHTGPLIESLFSPSCKILPVHYLWPRLIASLLATAQVRNLGTIHHLILSFLSPLPIFFPFTIYPSLNHMQSLPSLQMSSRSAPLPVSSHTTVRAF